MEQLELLLFGTFQARLDGEEITAFKSQRVRALLAYLAVEAKRPHSRATLAALLWPEYSEKDARNNLRYALYNLRLAIHDQQADPPFLIMEPETIQFNLKSNYNLDVTQFSRLLQAGKGQAAAPENLEQAIHFYRGEFLEGFSSPDSLELDEWLTLKRARNSSHAGGSAGGPGRSP